MQMCLFFSIFLTFFSCLKSEEIFIRKIAVKMNKDHKESVIESLFEDNFKLLYKITPQTYILQYVGPEKNSDMDDLLNHLKNKYKDEILAVERIQKYEDTIKPKTGSYTHIGSVNHDCVKSENYYGMGVSDAWSRGYTGKGVVIAVTDVGIHTNLTDLKSNINLELCYNYVTDCENITPEYFHNYQQRSSQFSSHGDKCASLIAAIFGNDFCSSGIAFNSTIVGLKIFEVKLYNNAFPALEPTIYTGSDVIALALSHNLSEIDIFSNSWAPIKRFNPLPMIIESAIEYGAETGRHGLGTIYVVPAGPTVNGFANNINTIAVNGVGRNGLIFIESFLSASVFTSGLAEGSNISAEYMCTTSRGNTCVTDFKGVSPATAQVAAIIGLALEANPSLHNRDIQNLLIQSSEPFGPENNNGFVRNHVGRFFHEVFGYGLLNASKLVTLAKNRNTNLPPVLHRRANQLPSRVKNEDEYAMIFCHSCSGNQLCLGLVEQVIIKMNIPKDFGVVQVVLISPSGTKSVLFKPDGRVETQLGDEEHQQFKSVHFWDEPAIGEWYLVISGNLHGHKISFDAELLLFGTETHLSNLADYLCPSKVENNGFVNELENNEFVKELENNEFAKELEKNGLVIFCTIVLILCQILIIITIGSIGR